MKNIVLLISFMLMISCSNNKSFENKESLVDENPVKNYSINSLVKEKFLEFYDLNLLLENNPQFEKNIKERLSYFTLDSNKILTLNKASKIKNIKIIKNNSDINLKLLFDIEFNNSSKKDSLRVIIIEEQVILDANTITATKVKFSRFD
tara:strand:- start:105 stop:551 length:447 start_codon:yes stop_codon:yes gene_type:complete